MKKESYWLVGHPVAIKVLWKAMGEESKPSELRPLKRRHGQWKVRVVEVTEEVLQRKEKEEETKNGTTCEE